jgi:mannose-6-phosphate isomerase-like protein (cupin superfamily)
MAHIPADVPHATFNTGSGVLRFLAVLSPVQADGPFTIDVYDEAPWSTLRPAIPYPGYTPSK